MGDGESWEWIVPNKRSDVFEEEVMIIDASTEAGGYTFYIYTYYSYLILYQCGCLNGILTF